MRRINDGSKNGMKMDRFRHSRFEDDENLRNDYSGVPYKSANTIGGPYEETRGRRSADDRQWSGSPYEDQREQNWNHRQGWDEYYNQSYQKGFRNHGGAQRGHDSEGHVGKGPRGYKRSDESIYHDVCDTLTMSPDINATDIEVSVKEGVVYLNGSVPDRASKKNAELDIENISGVIDVQNLLNIGDQNQDLH
jgi:hypothetical protein